MPLGQWLAEQYQGSRQCQWVGIYFLRIGQGEPRVKVAGVVIRGISGFIAREFLQNFLAAYTAVNKTAHEAIRDAFFLESVPVSHG